MSARSCAEKVDEISGAIGEITLFQSTHGYYAHGLPPEAAPPPSDGWQERLVVHQEPKHAGMHGAVSPP